MIRVQSYLVLFLVVTALVGSVSSRVGAQTNIGAIVLVPGDYVRVTVWRKPELSGEFLVAADGSLKHPLYQDVKVGGLSISAAQERLREYLTRLESAPQLSIEPLFLVTVGGEVRTPNLYRLSPETNLAQAVALAGGPTERGRLDRVSLLRNRTTITLDLTQPDAIRLPIQSGDRIFIQKRRDFLRDSLGPMASLAAALISIAVYLKK